MAYNTNTDYSALKSELEKQLAAATDEATKANLQAQINAADQSRIEKIASNLNTYGKYANENELDSAAGIQATNQIGTGYETQKANLNKSYDQAIQNANNNALSRGMARSSFVQDRMANLDSERANALSGVDAAKALAIQNAKQTILDNYRTNTANAETAEYNKNLNKANNLAKYGDMSGYLVVGYTPEQIANMNNYFLQQETKSSNSGSGGGGDDDGDDDVGNNDIFNSGTPLPSTNIKASNGLVAGVMAGIANTGAAQEIKQLRANGYTTEQIKGIINGMNMSTAERNTYLKYLGS